MSSSPESVTLVKEGIHNPAETRHFMRIAQPSSTVVAVLGDTELARSTAVLKVKEVGYDIYDPVIYFPRADVNMDLLTATEKTTHCPLKGDTAYFDASVAGTVTADVAWSYVDTIDIASAIKDYVAFDTSQVQVTEFTAGG